VSDTPKCEPPEELRGVDGWHWVRWFEYPPGDEFTAQWDGDAAEWCETHLNGDSGRRYLYVSPALTPAEADALRAERDDWQQAAQVEAAQVNALRARVAVLEEALQSIANHPEAEIVLTDYGPDGRQRVWPTVAQEARAALSTGSKTPAGTRGEP
jgi:enamine deaminase RidA (YjgF/YER057c/UK114 family)